MHSRLRLLAFLCCIDLASAANGTAFGSRYCKDFLQPLSDRRGYFRMMGLNTPDVEASLKGLSGLSPDECFQIAGRWGNNMIAAVGSIYSYIAQVKYHPQTDTKFSSLQAKRIANARDLLFSVRASEWTVAEGEMRNGDHLFMGITGHFLVIRTDGSAWKGVAANYYQVPLYEAGESDFERDGKIKMQELHAVP